MKNEIERDVVRAAKVIASLEQFLNQIKAQLAEVAASKENEYRANADKVDKLSNRISSKAGRVWDVLMDLASDLDDAADKLDPGVMARKLASRMAKARCAAARKR